MSSEEFISEEIKPDASTFNAHALIGGAPTMPKTFTWRGEAFEVGAVLETWKETGPAREAGNTQYLRKHWFRIRTTSGQVMKIYFERSARSAKQRKTRWWLYTREKP